MTTMGAIVWRSNYPEKWTEEERAAWTVDYLAGRPVELPHAEHDEGKCAYCDSLRALMYAANES